MRALIVVVVLGGCVDQPTAEHVAPVPLTQTIESACGPRPMFPGAVAYQHDGLATMLQADYDRLLAMARYSDDWAWCVTHHQP